MMSRVARMLLVVPVLAAAQAPAKPVAHPVGWLTGCWTLEQGKRITVESWRAGGAGFLIGSSKATNDGRVTETEAVRLEFRDKLVVYHVSMNGRPEVEFTAAPPASQAVIFENPQHDFPKRIGYQLATKDSLTAWIDGGEGSRRITYPYHRTTCTP